jgi:hypothetical protein
MLDSTRWTLIYGAVCVAMLGCGSSDNNTDTNSATGASATDAVAHAVADIQPFGAGKITGTFKLEQNAKGTVTGTADLQNCEEGKTYYVFIRDGNSCTSAAVGSRWSQDPDGAFGDCNGGKVFAIAVRIAQTTLPSDWSIGDPSKSNVVGHTVIVTLDDELVSTSTNIGCGVIKKS